MKNNKYKKFFNKVAIVTGAARGIGRSTATRLAKEGATVVLADINPDVEKTAQEINEESGNDLCLGKIVDVSLSDEVDNLINEVVSKFRKIDILVNNAGINQKMTKLEETSDEIFNRIMNVNLRGVFNCSRSAYSQMIKQGQGGNIVNIASYFAKKGYAYFAVYCASKAAVINFTQTHALEAIKHNIRVNCICPGNMMTEMHMQSLKEEAEIKKATVEEIIEATKNNIPANRHGTGDDIAEAVIFLCSEASSYTIGEALNVSGGLEMG